MQAFSMIDFPGKLACVIFVGKCNFMCPYCHNPALVFDPESQPEISEKKFMAFLDKRVGRLDGVVISGGEPSLRRGLIPFAKKIKAKGFLIKLDTNGSMPEKVFELHREAGIDWLGVDYKAPAGKYNEVSRCNIPGIAEKVHSVIRFAVENRIPIDVRTTVHKHLLSPEDLQTMRDELSSLGQKQWTLQQFNPAELIDESLLQHGSYTDRELLFSADALGDTQVRGLKGIIIHH
jgi:pyruvate formate lyase activating enzyme